jgi:hypothetical protein
MKEGSPWLISVAMTDEVVFAVEDFLNYRGAAEILVRPVEE